MTDTTAMDALAGLLDEKRRYEGWLTQLEARRDAAPSHVFARVRSDYLDRLRGVTEELRGRAADLEAGAVSLASQIATLLSEETARRDERAEADLRAAVGELEPDAAEQALARCDEQIAGLSLQRGTLGAELARLQDILLQVQPPPPPAPLPPAEPAVAHDTPLSPAPIAPPAAQPFDELAFLHSVVTAKEGHSSPATVSPSPSVPTEDQLTNGHLDPLRAPVPGAPRRSATEEVAAVRVPSLTPEGMASFFKDVPTEQVKTLKCQECGTMNYPTEWYCERCGGELAAM